MSDSIPVGFDILAIAVISAILAVGLYMRQYTWMVTAGLGFIIFGYLGLCLGASLAFPSLVHTVVFPLLDVFVIITAFGIPNLGLATGESLLGTRSPGRRSLHILALLLLAVDLSLISTMHGNLIEIFGYSVILLATIKLPYIHENIDELNVFLTLLSAFSLWRFVHSCYWGHILLPFSVFADEAVKWLNKKHEYSGFRFLHLLYSHRADADDVLLSRFSSSCN